MVADSGLMAISTKPLAEPIRNAADQSTQKEVLAPATSGRSEKLKVLVIQAEASAKPPARLVANPMAVTSWAKMVPRKPARGQSQAMARTLPMPRASQMKANTSMA